MAVVINNQQSCTRQGHGSSQRVFKVGIKMQPRGAITDLGDISRRKDHAPDEFSCPSQADSAGMSNQWCHSWVALRRWSKQSEHPRNLKQGSNSKKMMKLFCIGFALVGRGPIKNQEGKASHLPAWVWVFKSVQWPSTVQLLINRKAICWKSRKPLIQPRVARH